MLEKELKKYFGFSEFRPGQKEVVESVMDGKDVVALMPTGGGKSLCYQMPAVLGKGITVIISPLIALMKDQVDGLNAREIPATFINSSLSRSEVKERMRKIKEGKIKLLYIAPERLGSPEFGEFFKNLEISFLAVDEAHCVSQWGHDFRPDYLAIRKNIEKLKKRPVIGAFTATATPEVKNDIIERLGLQEPKVFVRGFDRANLKFFAQNNLKPKEKLIEILRLTRSMEGSGIIYSLTRKDTENIAMFLNQNEIGATAYHAGMDANKRTKIQNEFMDNRFKVIVATIAFGMGVDKADIRFVIHAGMPKNLEGYYQEAGRAGRDGEIAYCILLHGKKDVSTHRFFIRKEGWEMLNQGKDEREVDGLTSIKEDRLNKMINYATSNQCRRRIILEYFDDPDSQRLKDGCDGCDVCMNWERQDDGETETEIKLKKQERTGKVNEMSGTILETVKFRKDGYSPEKIAKIRSLSEETVLSHLIKWYLAGGDLKIEKFITLEEEKQILKAMAEADDYQKLRPIKERLPESVSYGKIKLVIAKIQKIEL
jgi:ATP-dependent DNA helicase RecQ